MGAQLELWQETIDERPSYARASGPILRFEDPVETRTRRREESWQETAARRRMALDEREVRMRESDRKLRELGLL
jgi:hypothetical protein